MTGRRPQPVTQATTPNPFMPPMPQQLGGPQQMSGPPVGRPMPQQYGGQMQQPSMLSQFQGAPMFSGAPRTTNGKNGGYRPPQQQFNPFGGGGCGGGGFF